MNLRPWKRKCSMCKRERLVFRHVHQTLGIAMCERCDFVTVST